jgi:uncharacterized protein
MDVTPLVHRDSQIIQSYGENGFRVSAEAYSQPIIVRPDCVMLWDAPQSAHAALLLEHVSIFGDIAEHVDIVLLGTGARAVQPPAEVRGYFKTCGLSVDVMDTGAACRTYNVLMAEGRRVAAALFLPE